MTRARAQGRTTSPLLALVTVLALALTACSDDSPAAGDARSSEEPSATPSASPSDSATDEATSAPPTATDPSTSSAPPATTPAGPDPVCGGLELDVVRDVLAPDMKSYLAEVDYCIFSRPREQRPTLIVTAVPTLGDPAEFAQQTRDACAGDVTDVPDVGDAALVCTFPAFGPQGYVIDGDAFVQLDLASGDDRADLASLLELVPHVVVPTGLEIPE